MSWRILFNRFTQQSHLEIESKMSCHSERAFLDMYNFAEGGGLKNFRVEEKFPHLLSRGLRVYYSEDKNTITKFVLHGIKEPTVVNKGSLCLLDNRFGLNCILKRSEHKNNHPSKSLLEKISPAKENWIDKRKLVFWVENSETGRIYHIAHDKCRSNKRKPLSQVEVEYAGTLNPNTSDEEAIVDDVSYITTQLIDKFSYLKPTKIRKEEWINI